MAIYIDPVASHAPVCGYTEWCHMGTDDRSPEGLEKLHELAARIGLKRRWFQDKPRHKHYDVTAGKRWQAIRAGAIQVTQREYVLKCSDSEALKRYVLEEDDGQ